MWFSSYWWRNLLFIQNLFLHKELCMNWSWTLANEMQFFVICTFIYVAYCKSKIFGKLFFCVTVIVIASTSNYLLIKNNFMPTFDIMFTTLDDLYISPFSRAPPYLVGVGMAYFVVKGKMKISNVINKFNLQKLSKVENIFLVCFKSNVGFNDNRFHVYIRTTNQSKYFGLVFNTKLFFGQMDIGYMFFLVFFKCSFGT